MKVCIYCKKKLPEPARKDQMFCPAEKGRPRCRDLAKRERHKTSRRIEIGDLYRQAPPGVAGFRIRLVVDSRTTWVSPVPGQRVHKDAEGRFQPGDFWRLSEKLRVPLDAEYRVDFCDESGRLLWVPEDAPSIWLTKNCAARLCMNRPGPTLRIKQKAVEAGFAPPARPRRLWEIAADLGITSKDLLAHLSDHGAVYTATTQTVDADEAAAIVQRYAERTLPATYRARVLSSLPNQNRPDTAEPANSDDPDLSEALPVPPMIELEHRQVLEETRSIARLSAATSEAMNRDQATMVSDVARLAGLTDEPKGGAA